ncbi:interleukin 23 subunit alpha [Rhinolophus ferrumequinum]|uniref:Interleukin 23 subunit alpha n=1 Tax=Rhinolophus ferrumequinum TaxID=59479 RepID=A0A7J7WQ70_RHIFE|nr:interleukin 23 subunit alpha [Rhinolophus ferrumequinum]
MTRLQMMSPISSVRMAVIPKDSGTTVSPACKGSTRAWFFMRSCWTQTFSQGSPLYSPKAL